MNLVLPKKDVIIIPDSFVRTKIMMAMSQINMDRPLLDKLLIIPSDEWYKLSTDELYTQLQFVLTSSRVVQTTTILSSQSNYTSYKHSYRGYFDGFPEIFPVPPRFSMYTTGTSDNRVPMLSTFAVKV